MSKPESVTTAMDHLSSMEIELIAEQVYSFTHKGRQWKKWSQLDEVVRKTYISGVKSGINIILHNRSLP